MSPEVDYSFARNTGTGLCTVTHTAHGLLVGQQYQIWASFTSVSVLSIPTSNTYTIFVTGVNTFTFTAAGNGTTTTVTGKLNYLVTGGAVYAQSGLTITVTLTAHGFPSGGYVLMNFCGGSYAVAKNDTNYLIQQVLNADQFTVKAISSGGSSGGVALAIATVLSTTALVATSGRCSLSVFALQMRTNAIVRTGGKIDFEVGRTAMATKALIRTGGAPPEMMLISRVMRSTALVTSRLNTNLSVALPMRSTALITTGGSTPSMGLSIPTLTFSARVRCEVRASGAFFVQKDRYSVTDACDDAVKISFYQNLMQMTPDKRQRVVDDLNATLALIFSRAGLADGIDYFNQDVRTYTIPAGESTFTMPADVECINGPLTLVNGNKIIRPLSNLSEVARWPSVSPEVSNVPQVYYSNRSGATTATAFTHVLNFSPAPAANCDFTAEVSYRAPVYTLDDYRKQTPLAIAGNHTTAILFPILRFMTQSSVDVTSKPDKIAAMKQQYIDAMRMLGITDPIAVAAATGGTQKAKQEAKA